MLRSLQDCVSLQPHLLLLLSSPLQQKVQQQPAHSQPPHQMWIVHFSTRLERYWNCVQKGYCITTVCIFLQILVCLDPLDFDKIKAILKTLCIKNSILYYSSLQHGDTWNSTNCTKDKCENGKVITESLCNQFPVPVCENGEPPVKVYDGNGCCFHYECRCKFKLTKVFFISGLSPATVSIIFVSCLQVCVMAGEILIISHSTGSITVSRKIVHMFWFKRSFLYTTFLSSSTMRTVMLLEL